MMEAWQNWLMILIAFLVSCVFVAPSCIFLPRLFGAISSAQVRADMRKHWLQNTVLAVLTATTIMIYICAFWFFHRNQ